jgi:hypothetical protein
VTLAMLGSAAVLFPRFADRAIAAGVETTARLLGTG